MWRAAIKQKSELVLFYFYFSFIAVVQAALVVTLYFYIYSTRTKDAKLTYYLRKYKFLKTKDFLVRLS